MSYFRSPSGLLPDQVLYALTGLRMAKKIKDTVIKASIVNSIGAFMVQKGLHEGDFSFVIKKLKRDITCAKFAHMGTDGDQAYEFTAYNLDVIIFGASLKDAGKKLFAYIKMQETSTTDLLNNIRYNPIHVVMTLLFSCSIQFVIQFSAQESARSY